MLTEAGRDNAAHCTPRPLAAYMFQVDDVAFQKDADAEHADHRDADFDEISCSFPDRLL